jgi:hypothetical protein
MKRTRRLVGGLGLTLACAGAATLGHASHPQAAAASTGAGCTNPPAVFPEDKVTAGLTGTGKTVLNGTTPTSFGVKVLGVLSDGIAPGLDLIVVKLSGPVVDQAGGAFEGISGSPVYVNGKLMGAVSYALSFDRTVAGLTPAQPMVNLFDYPRASTSALPQQMPMHVKLTPKLQSAVTAASHVTTSSTGSMTLLKVPVGVSGLTDAGLQRLQRTFNRHHLAYTAFRGGAAAAPSGVTGAAIVAGGNFAATQSFGDLTFYGLGTATAVCGDETVAFGHPFGLTGPSALGMNNADTITIVKDPFFPYKLANITGFRGIVDQDRLAGIRGISGTLPQLTSVTTSLRNADLGTSRTGRTDIADQGLMTLIAQYAVFVENVVTFDREGSGSETMDWTITGTFQGEPFTLTRTGVQYSPYDITYEGPLELMGELGALQKNKFGSARITGVHFGGTLTQVQETATITKVESRTGHHPFAVRRVLRVRPGGTVHLRVTLTHPDGTASVVAMSVEVPGRFRGGVLELRGGIPPQGCPYCAFGETFRTNATSFAGLLAQFAHGEHRNDLIASLGAGVKTSVSTPRVVLGRKAIFLVRR